MAGDLAFDVVVIGGGIAGATAALALKRDGARVALLERGVICGGATGFTTAKVSALQGTMLSEIAQLRDEATVAAYAAASLQAVASIDELVRDEHIDCGWERVAAYTYAAGDDDVEAIEAEADAALRAGLTVRIDDVSRLRKGRVVGRNDRLDQRRCTAGERALGELGRRRAPIAVVVVDIHRDRFMRRRGHVGGSRGRTPSGCAAGLGNGQLLPRGLEP